MKVQIDFLLYNLSKFYNVYWDMVERDDIVVGIEINGIEKYSPTVYSKRLNYIYVN